jgi:predicted nucleotide-binding protein
MEQLEKGATKVEYAVFVLDPGESGEADDEMRKACLEFGYFMGKLGRPKTFIVVPKSHVDDLPTPLSTLGSVAYDDTRTDRDLPQALTQAATNIRERILEQEQRRHGG